MEVSECVRALCMFSLSDRELEGKRKEEGRKRGGREEEDGEMEGMVCGTRPKLNTTNTASPVYDLYVWR